MALIRKDTVSERSSNSHTVKSNLGIFLKEMALYSFTKLRPRTSYSTNKIIWATIQFDWVKGSVVTVYVFCLLLPEMTYTCHILRLSQGLLSRIVVVMQTSTISVLEIKDTSVNPPRVASRESKTSVTNMPNAYASREWPVSAINCTLLA